MHLTPTLSVDEYALDMGVDFATTVIQEGGEIAVTSFDAARQVLHNLGMSDEEIDVRVAVAQNGTLAVATGAS